MPPDDGENVIPQTLKFEPQSRSSIVTRTHTRKKIISRKITNVRVCNLVAACINEFTRKVVQIWRQAVLDFAPQNSEALVSQNRLTTSQSN